MLALLVLALAVTTDSVTTFDTATGGTLNTGTINTGTVNTGNTFVGQDITSLPVYFACAGPLDESFFMLPPLSWYVCEDYLRALMVSGAGIIISPVIADWWSTTDLEFVTAEWDVLVRDQLAGATFTNECSQVQKTSEACALYFKPCNYTDDIEVFTSTPLCKESCLYTRGCSFADDCFELDNFDPDNASACALNSLNVDVTVLTDSSAVTLTSLVGLLMLFF